MARLGAARRQLAVEMPRDERRRAARDVDVLADQVAVDPRDEVVGIEVDVLDLRVQLRCDVVAQPLGIEPEVEVDVGAHARAARLRHLLAGGRDEAVDEHVVRHLVRRARELEHRRPEQRVEIDDVLADEMILIDVGALQKCIESDADLREVRLEAREIADRRVEPDVEVLAGRIRDLDAEVRRVARDVPVGEPLAFPGGLSCVAAKPFAAPCWRPRAAVVRASASIRAETRRTRDRKAGRRSGPTFSAPASRPTRWSTDS